MKKHLSSQQLTNLAEGVLAPHEREPLEAHLAGCPDCREALQRRQAIVGRLREGVPAHLERIVPPASLRWEKIRDRVPHTRNRHERIPAMRVWRSMRSAAGGLAVLAVLLGLVIGLTLLFRQVATPAAPMEEEPAPQAGPLVEMSGELPVGGGGFGGGNVPVTIRATLPNVPQEVLMYDGESVFQQISAEMVRAWAERLGMGQVEIYRPTGPGATDPAIFRALNDAWASLSLSQYGLNYSRGMLFGSVRAILSNVAVDESVDEATAQAAAQAFLDRVAPYLVTVEGGADAPEITYALESGTTTAGRLAGYYSYRVATMVGGVSLENEGGMENQIVVGPQGEVNYAMLSPLRLIPTGESVQVRAPQAALDDLMDGEPEVLRGSGWSTGLADGQEAPRYFYRDLDYRPGQALNVVGGLEMLRNVENDTDLYLLHGVSAPGAFVLQGSDLADIDAETLLQVWGTLGDAVEEGVWGLEVTRWEAADAALGSREGKVQRRDDGVWLQTTDGQALQLPDAPEDLPDGAQVTVVGMPTQEAPDRLEWSVIMLTPEGPADVESAGVSTEVVSEVVSAPTPALSPDDASARAGGQAQEATPTPAMVPPSAQSALVLAQPVPSVEIPDWWPHQPGDRAIVEGRLYVNGYELPDGTVEVEANLTVDPPDGEGEPFFLPLVGEPLAGLASLNQMQVRVTGQIVSVDEAAEELDGKAIKAGTEQVLRVEQAEKRWPESYKAVFSGPVQLTTLDGEEVGLLEDRFTGETYALPVDAVSWVLEQDQSDEVVISLIGVWEPGAEIAGYARLQVDQLSRGEDSADWLQEELDNPLHKIEAGSMGPGEVIIDQIRLAYRVQRVVMPDGAEGRLSQVEPQLLYYLIGRSPDGKYEVTLRVDAAQP